METPDIWCFWDNDQYIHLTRYTLNEENGAKSNSHIDNSMQCKSQKCFVPFLPILRRSIHKKDMKAGNYDMYITEWIFLEGYWLVSLFSFSFFIFSFLNGGRVGVRPLRPTWNQPLTSMSFIKLPKKCIKFSSMITLNLYP